MAVSQRTITQRDFSRSAQTFSAECSARGSVAENDATFSGDLRSLHLPSGIAVAYGDYRTLRPSVQTAVAPRSLYMSILFAPTTTEFHLDRQRIGTQTEAATALFLNDAMEISGHYRQARRLRAASIQVDPESLADSLVAERVDQALQATHFAELPLATDKVAALAQAFANEDDPGLRNILLESRILALLAECLQVPHAMGNASTDRRMARAREILLERPEADHSLTSLAREVGVCTTILKDAFPCLAPNDWAISW